jgi:hypothetical protein
MARIACSRDALQHRGEIEIDSEFPSDQPLSSFFRQVCAAATRAGPVLRSLMAEAQFDDFRDPEEMEVCKG